MINRPLAYKGPVDHLTHFFSENRLMDGFSLLLEDNLVNWQNIKEEKYIKGTCLCDGQFTKQILDWPLTESVGSCSCEDQLKKGELADFPCVHLAALAIESKTRLHRLPPSTNQHSHLATGKRYIKKWLSKQKLDPFPAMARHRVIYLLQEKQGQWVVEVFKAYLTKESEFQIKSPLNLIESIDFELSGKKNTKFFSIADQQILYFIENQLGCTLRSTESLCDQDRLDSNQFTIKGNIEGNKVIKLLALTDRLFWQSSHRPAMVLSNRNPNFWRDGQQAELNKISENYYLDLKHNAVIEIFEKAAEKSKALFPQLMNKREFEIKPVLKITSSEIVLPWRKDKASAFDIAKLSFLVNDREFSLKNLLPLVLEREARKEFSEKLADYLLQIENLAVLEACYEIPVIEKFHFGDREFDAHLSHMLPILNGLYNLGWKIEIERGFRLNQIASHDWYIDIRQGVDTDQEKQKQHGAVELTKELAEPQQLSLLIDTEEVTTSKTEINEFDWFELEVGVKVKGESINLMPYIVSLIQREELNFNQANDESQLNIKLDTGETLSLERERVVAIFSSFVELNSEKSLSETKRLRLPSNQFGRLIPLLDIDKPSKEKNETGEKAENKVSWENGKQLAKQAKQLDNESGITSVSVPRELRGELRDYQHAGVNWLQFIRKHRLGGILADANASTHIN
jgi:hypothetical protein